MKGRSTASGSSNNTLTQRFLGCLSKLKYGVF